jgi:trans-2,3-dihydro-3-hydroxyanthranilate isomerase
MENCEVRLVDTFATEPTGGRTVAVVDGELDAEQRQAVASEVGTSGVVTAGAEVTYTDCDGSQAVVSGAVAGLAALLESGAVDPGDHELAVDGPVSPAAPFLVDVGADGRVEVEVGTLTPENAGVEPARIAEVLGTDPAALEDVGADLPVGRVEAFGGTLLAPVNFLQHLTGADPDAGALATLLAEQDARRLCAFTFDTLDAETELHARVFDPGARGDEHPASGVAAAACSAHLAEQAVFDGDREEITVESGHVMNRPATVTATLSTQPQVSGGALASLSGPLTLPESDDDEIIEL